MLLLEPNWLVNVGGDEARGSCKTALVECPDSIVREVLEEPTELLVEGACTDRCSSTLPVLGAVEGVARLS